MKEIKQIDNRPNTSKKCLFSSSLICNLDVLFSTVQSTDSVRRNSMDSPTPLGVYMMNNRCVMKMLFG